MFHENTKLSVSLATVSLNERLIKRDTQTLIEHINVLIAMNFSSLLDFLIYIQKLEIHKQI